MDVNAAVKRRDDFITITPALPRDASVTTSLARMHAQSRAAGRDSETALRGSNLAQFWELRGRRVFERSGVLWGRGAGPFYSSLPFHLQLDPDPEEVQSILRSESIMGLRFPSANRPGISAGAYVCRPAGYGLQSVNRQQRGNVTRGLDACEFRKVDPDQLLIEGMDLNRDTFLRQGRSDGDFLDPVKWKKFVQAVSRCPGMTIHGALVDGRLSAYLISCRDGEWLHLMYQMSRTADLPLNPNHALDYSVIRDAATIPGIEYIGHGSAAVQEHQELDRYKCQLGYQLQRHNLCIHFHPAFAPLANSRVTVFVARKAVSFFPANRGLARGVAMLEGARLSDPQPVADPIAGENLCRQKNAMRLSRLLQPAILFPLRVKDHFRGLLAGAAKIKAVERHLGPEEVLQLQPGEWVEVKSLAEIRASLDERGRHRGLHFSDDMRSFAGQRYRVFKRVESALLEDSRPQRTPKNTVLLDAVYRPGVTSCGDPSCLLFWKEAWLRRIDAPVSIETLDGHLSEVRNRSGMA